MGKIKDLFTNVNFILKFVAWVVVIVIVMLWGVGDFSNGMWGTHKEVLFGHTPPAYNVVLLGMVIGYILDAGPTNNLVYIWEGCGIVLFIVTAIITIMDNSGNHALIFMILELGVAAIFLADIIMKLTGSGGGGEE